jgi:hypothetical protein
MNEAYSDHNIELSPDEDNNIGAKKPAKKGKKKKKKKKGRNSSMSESEYEFSDAGS